MTLNFPTDKTELVPPGTGDLVTGDTWRDPSNSVLYTYNASHKSWTGPTSMTADTDDGFLIIGED